jgi:transposase
MRSKVTNHQYKDYNPDKRFLLPPDMRDWLPKDHMVFFILRQVEAMDLSAFDKLPTHTKGQPPYHYQMLITVLLYAYSVGITSSRMIERKTYEESAFRIASGDQHPDFHTINNFRRENLCALSDLFSAQLLYFHSLGLIPLQVVSQDGTKIQANASSHKNLTYEKMLQKEEVLTEVRRITQKILSDAEEMDRSEDQSFGKEENPYLIQVPPSYQNKPIEEIQKELKQIQDIIDQTREEKQKQAKKEKQQQQEHPGKNKSKEPTKTNKKPGKETNEKQSQPIKQEMPLSPHEIEPDPTTKRNRTDFDSRLMKSGSNGGYFQAFNVQLAIDHYCGLIAGIQVTQDHNDQHQVYPMLMEIEKHYHTFPKQYLADKGYANEKNYAFLAEKRVDAFVATPAPRGDKSKTAVDVDKDVDYQANGYTGRTGFNLMELMRLKLKTEMGKDMYRIRGWLSEGPFGYLKQTLGFTQFSLRGKQKVEREAHLRGFGYNLRKVYLLQLKSPFIREKLCLNPG